MKIKNKKTYVAGAIKAALLTCISGTAIAEDKIETITVTANRSEQSLDKVLSSVKIITRQEIEQLQPKSILELLHSVAGIDISQQGGRGQSSSIFMRGTNANHTLVLLDGIRISSATLGTANIQTIAPSQIERIEVIKGSRTAIWGSDAIGGVIQIFTRQSSGISAEVNLGSQGYKQIAGAISFEHGEGHSNISINSEQADGFDVLATAEPDDDGFEALSISASGSQPLTRQLEMTYLLQMNKNDNEYDNAWAGNNKVDTDNYAWFVGANYSFSDVNQVAFKLGQNQDSALNYGTEYEDLYETIRDQFSVVSSNHITPEASITLGVDYNNESITTTSAYPTDERSVFGAFVHTDYKVGQFLFEIALRHDDVENIDSESTYNLGLGYDLSDATTLVLSHSTGFKAPTFNDLYSPFGGNPDLVSETSMTTELLVKHSVSAGSIGASIYKTDVDDLIEWAPQSDGSWQPSNINKAEITGFEIDTSLSTGSFLHKFSLAYIDTEDKSTGEQLIRRAKEHFNYSINANLDAFNFTLAYNFKGERTDSGGVELDGYSLVNANVGYQVTPSFKVNFKVNNLLDEEYMTANNYNTQGQTVYIGVNYSH